MGDSGTNNQFALVGIMLFVLPRGKFDLLSADAMHAILAVKEQ
jgi:hypothetical protein